MKSEMPRNVGFLHPFVANVAATLVFRLNVASPDVRLRPVALAVRAELAPAHVLPKRLGSLEAAFQAFRTRAL